MSLFSDLACCGDACDEEDCECTEYCGGNCDDDYCCGDESKCTCLKCCGNACLNEECCDAVCACAEDVSAYDLMDLMAVTVPEGRSGGWVIERFEVQRMSLGNVRNAMEGRGTRPGRYTRLLEYKDPSRIGSGFMGLSDTVWMSDVDAERRDHLPAVRRISQPETRSVLIHGLGIGMVLQAAMTFDHIERIDVVELDERVIEMIGPHYTADSRVRIHHADAYQQGHKWPDGSRWDVIWSDIWPDINEDNAEMMRLLKRIYEGRCGWHGFWGADTMRKRWGVRI